MIFASFVLILWNICPISNGFCHATRLTWKDYWTTCWLTLNLVNVLKTCLPSRPRPFCWLPTAEGELYIPRCARVVDADVPCIRHATSPTCEYIVLTVDQLDSVNRLCPHYRPCRSYFLHWPQSTLRHWSHIPHLILRSFPDLLYTSFGEHRLGCFTDIWRHCGLGVCGHHLLHCQIFSSVFQVGCPLSWWAAS